MNKKGPVKKGRPRRWLIPVLVLLVAGAGVGGHFIAKYWRPSFAASQPTATGPGASGERTQEDLRASMLDTLMRETFFEGIWIDDIDCSGQSLEAVRLALLQREQVQNSQLVLSFEHQDASWPVTALACGRKTDWADVLERAWAVGRVPTDAPDHELEAAFEQVEALKTEPLVLTTTVSWDNVLIEKTLKRLAAAIDVQPRGATATGFDVASRSFVIEEGWPGFTTDLSACHDLVVSHLQAGAEDARTAVAGKTTTSGKSAAELGKALGFVSEARTYARAYNPPRDENIRLICQKINGMVLQPGESFSFNRYIGQRTAARGFKPAGGIVNGILEPDIYGGGICQPNTTLYQAVVMADLEIIERHPHSWPSSYTQIGMDATVNWPGADFKFRNNTDDPVAIVAWYDKPAVVFQVYGRALEDGVSISITSTHDGYIPVDKPIERLNPDLKPGQKVVIREEHIGQLSTSYKVWTKDGSVIKRERLAKSRYPSIQAIIDHGPPKEEKEDPKEDEKPSETSPPAVEEEKPPAQTQPQETTGEKPEAEPETEEKTDS